MLGTIVGTIVVICGVLMVIGLTMSAEDIVKTRADGVNLDRGVIVDEVTWLDGTSSGGTALMLTYTLMDDWCGHMPAMLREMVGDNPTVDQILPALTAGQKELACEAHGELGRDEITVIVEFRDERGATLFSVEANSTNC